MSDIGADAKETTRSASGKETKALFVVSRLDSDGAKEYTSCRSREMLKNEYFLSKIGVNTAENEPFDFHNFGSLQGFNFHRPVVSAITACSTAGCC